MRQKWLFWQWKVLHNIGEELYYSHMGYPLSIFTFFNEKNG